MKTLYLLPAGLGAWLLAGCITINIYFPAGAAEKAADKIIDEVWQIQNPQPAQTPPEKTQ